MTPDHTADLIQRLADAPKRIAQAVAELSESQTRTVPGPDQWSIAELFAHIRASDDVLTPRVYMMLIRDNPPFPVLEERRLAEVAGYNRMDLRDSLVVYTLRRAEFVGALRTIAPEDWSRQGQHEINGTVILRDIAQHIANHEDEHCTQIEAICAQLSMKN